MSNKQKLIGNRSRGRIFIVSAPAGTGKTTLVSMLAKEFDQVKMSISCTTRKPRPYEVDGVHYHFLTPAQFEERIARGDFLEHVKLYGDHYGTSYKFIEDILEKGQHVVLVIDTQGALMLMGKIDAAFIFILPPSKEELQRRLESRGTEQESVLKERLRIAEREMNEAPKYDYQIINDDLSCAYQVLRSIVIAEEHKSK